MFTLFVPSPAFLGGFWLDADDDLSPPSPPQPPHPPPPRGSLITHMRDFFHMCWQNEDSLFYLLIKCPSQCILFRNCG